jgi:hypothetical protein
MKLSAPDRQAIEVQMNQCKKAGLRVWSVSHRLEKSLTTFTVDITPTGYTITLTEDDQPVRTATVVASAPYGTTEESGREFLLEVDQILQNL